jgi:hypothetical protein
MKGLNASYASSPAIVLVISFLALFLPVILIEADVLRYTNGIFMYPLDDTFIHLEIGKNVKGGNWGVNPNEFASASSSLLYTVILTIGRFISTDTIVPFLINCLAGAILVWALHRWLKKQEVSARAQMLIILLAIFLTPLATLMVSGMEHTLQCLFSFLFIVSFSDWLERNRYVKKAALSWPILASAVAAACIRYEGLFLVGIAGVLLLYYRKLRPALALGFFALLPVVAFGVFSISKGSYFLPNSVLVKSETNTSGLLSFVSTILVEKLTFAKSGMAALATQRWLLILPLLFLFFRKHLRPSYSFILIFLMAATFLQLGLAATGWLYRYEAYLFFCAVVITGLLFHKYGRSVLPGYLNQWGVVLTIVVFFLVFPIALRSATALTKTDRACKNIFDQQYQMARFSQKYYNNSTIAANDIGAISYFTDASIVDLWGLASIEVTRSRKNKYWTPEFLDSLCRARQVKLVMVYDSWFSDSLTGKWKKQATWQIQNNVICGDSIVSFYSIDTSGSTMLQKNLKEFQSSLPPSVQVKYY